MHIEYTLARMGAERLWKLINEGGDSYVHALGALTGEGGVGWGGVRTTGRALGEGEGLWAGRSRQGRWLGSVTQSRASCVRTSTASSPARGAVPRPRSGGALAPTSAAIA